MTTAYIAALLPQAIRTPLRNLLVHVLKIGPLPDHAAFIMDGNRRFAKTHQLSTASKGHVHGFAALKGLLNFLLELDVKQVTLYAFALNNFDRPAEEVDTIMELARVNLLELAQRDALLQHYGVRVFIIGRMDMLPPTVQEACREIERLTQHNSQSVQTSFKSAALSHEVFTSAFLNVCVAYSSQDEISQAIRLSAADSTSADPSPNDITKRLMTSRNPHWTSPDILIRTSGVNRLSDFLLWQMNSTTAIHVLPCFWPDIGVADVIPVLLGWQANKLAERSRRWLPT